MIDKCPCINGRCNTAGLCICNQGWTGGVCDVQKNCSCINGVCNQTLGKCVCDDGFTGIDINLMFDTFSDNLRIIWDSRTIDVDVQTTN